MKENWRYNMEFRTGMGLPPPGKYRRIKDDVLVEVIKYSKDKSVVYVTKTYSDGKKQPWDIFTRNFWKFYKKDESQ
jgi:hypothetical protein